MSERLVQHYKDLLLKHGDSPAAAQYSSRASQEARFSVLCDVGDLSGATLLDFGCGTGHLATYLSDQGTHPSSYTGIDVVPEMIDVARAKHPAHRFGRPGEYAAERFDYALVSGVFNNRRPGNRKFYQSTVADLYTRCRVGVAFNMLSTYVDYRDRELFYEHPERVLSFVKRQVSPYVVLRHDYCVKPNVIPFEFTVFVYREPSQGRT